MQRTKVVSVRLPADKLATAINAYKRMMGRCPNNIGVMLKILLDQFLLDYATPTDYVEGIEDATDVFAEVREEQMYTNLKVMRATREIDPEVLAESTRIAMEALKGWDKPADNAAEANKEE